MALSGTALIYFGHLQHQRLLTRTCTSSQNVSPMKHELPTLPYALHELAPRMSLETLNFHYGKHLQAYLDKVNQLTQDTELAELPLKDIIKQTATGPLFNNAAQAYNHILFFKQLTPQPTQMSTTLSQELAARFGSVEAFKEAFTQAAINLFGSGWVWLACDNNNVLQLLSSPNADNPLVHNMRPLLCIDVWEHAYYLDYQNRRADYVNNFWYLINWQRVESRMQNDCLLYY